MIRTNIKMQVTPEQLAKVQQICFDNNIYWRDTGNTLEKNIKFICLLTTGICTFHNSTIFNANRSKEIDPELFIATNGTCNTNIQSLTLSPEQLKLFLDGKDFEVPKHLANNPEKLLKELDAELMKSTHTKSLCAHPGVNNTTGNCISCGEHIDKSEFSTKTNKFAEYGFETPDFQCKLYDKLDDYILGAYFNPNKQKWTMCRWGFDGRNKQGSHNYALTPILVHKPWYETCKFPVLVYRSQDDTCLLITDKDGYSKEYLNNLRPYTDTEIEELKRGF